MEMMVHSGSLEPAGTEVAPNAPQRPVDLVHLSRYTLGNRALEREILELFRTQSSLYLRKLKEAVSDKAWHDAAHTIKGSARGIGAWHVACAAESAENAANVARAETKGEIIEALAARIEEANGFISAVLADA